jgi:malignant T-cell-amplified sequence
LYLAYSAIGPSFAAIAGFLFLIRFPASEDIPMTRFRTFSADSITSRNRLSNAVVRRLKSEYGQSIKRLLTEEDSLEIIKTSDKQSIILGNRVPLFILVGDKFVPTTRALHLLPGLLKRVVVDEGAIRPIVNGANVMAPGLLKGGSFYSGVSRGEYVGIYGEKKESAMAVGEALMNSEEASEKESGVAIEVISHLGDALYHFGAVK